MADEVKEKNGGYYHSLFKDALNFESKRFEKYAELAAFYELEQQNLPNYSGTKPWVFDVNLPFATDAINLRVSSLQASDYKGELEPLSPDDVETVEQLNNVYHEFWEEMNMDKFINDSILVSAVVGQAYTHIILEPEKTVGTRERKRKGKLTPYFLDTSSVLVDPKALSIREADYVCVVERITRKKAKKEYPNLNWEENKEGFLGAGDRGEIYYGNDYTSEKDHDVLSKITIYERIDEDTIEKTVLIEAMIAEETKELGINVFPIAQLRWQKKIKSPYGTSLMEMLLPLQKVVNEIESANANANMQYSSPSYVLSEDAGIDPEDLALSAGAPGSVYVVASGQNINDVIKPLIPDRGIDDGLVVTKQELERSIYKLAGVSDQFLGSMGTVGNTSTGADLAMQRAKTIENAVIVNIEEFVEDLTGIIVSFIVSGFLGEKIYARGEKRSDGGYNFKEFKVPEDAKEVEYNFFIKLDVKTKYSKERHRVLIQELFATERQYDTGDLKGLTFLDVLKAYDMPQTQELVERYEQLTKMDAEQRSQLISEFVTAGTQFGVDAQMINAAISEILLNQKETPAVEMLMQAIEQAAMMQEQGVQNVVDGATNATMQNQMQEQQMQEEMAMQTQEFNAAPQNDEIM